MKSAYHRLLTLKIGVKATADLQKKLFKDTSDGKDIDYFAHMLDTDEMTEKNRKLCKLTDNET